jgi:chromatin assembly factor 1 subunit B
MLPGITTHANVIKFCPYLMKLKEIKEDDPAPLINLPYRMVFAVATIEHVLIYTTQSTYPISIVKNLHYDSINDLSWVFNSMLMIASSDGFCSFLQFEADTIGEMLPLDSELIPEYLREHY